MLKDTAGSTSERAVLVGIDWKSRTKPVPCRSEAGAEESLEELASLAATAGATVVQTVIQSRQAPDPATLIGSGKVQEIHGMVEGFEIDTVIFDHDLTPTQQRNLEKALDVKVLDRTQLILDIFASRARTREGQLQVELAQMNYLLPRLAGRGVQMSRLGGGIGTRGPGETQLETDRRKIYRKIKKIEEELEAVKAGRAIQRRQRVEVPLSTLALVGYTNAGKSTLFNRLTGAGVEADARLFATLDPTVRKLQLPSRRQVLLSDTVGFIRNLPTTLVKAFRATLEEVRQAAVLLHVVDVSSTLAAEHTEQVLDVLREIEADTSPQILVLNKADLLPDGLVQAETAAARLLGERAEAVKARAAAVSARTGDGIPRLLELIDEILAGEEITPIRFRIPAGDGAAINLVHERAQVREVVYKEEYCELTADAPESLRRRLREFVVE
ncbi:MAG: GTPase HflX [Bryobacterales bacterium]|nr:GTPase HflX [Bryobacterales bacterium]